MKGLIGCPLTILTWVVIFWPVSATLHETFNAPVWYWPGSPWLHEGRDHMLNGLITLFCLVGSIAVTGLIWGAIGKMVEVGSARRGVELARQQRHEREQQGYWDQMGTLGKQSVALFESMPNYLRSAESHLDQAEVDFSESAFAPFWDSVENAVKNLGYFDKAVRQINDNSSRYGELVQKYEVVPPRFPLSRQSLMKLGVSTGTAERMQAIVRKAQRNFQFAMIYEQRKTNQILVAGFTSLGQALVGMTSRIVESIDDLANSVDGMFSTFNRSVRDVHSHLGDIADTANRQLEEASEAASREREALEMLDNIQRGRRPFS